MTCRITWVAIALLFAGCSTTHDPLPNKSTNWLRECSSDDMCSDGLACLCGVCTKTCGRAADCGPEPATTRCTAVSNAALSNQCPPGSTGDPEAICVAACAHDGDCASSSGAFECRDQLCVVRAATGTPADAGRDASTSMPDAGHSTPDAGDGRDGGDGGEIVCNFDSGLCDAPCNVECASGQVCFGNACADVLVSDQDRPSSLALDSSHLYWTTFGTFEVPFKYLKDGAIQAVSLQSGEVTTLASNRVYPAGIVVNATHAYWLEGPNNNEAADSDKTANDNEVWRVPLAGGEPERLASAVLTTSGLAVDDRYVYLLVEEKVPSDPVPLSGTGAVFRMPNDGSAQLERLFNVDYGYGSNLFVDDAGLCWVVADHYSANLQSTGSDGPRKVGQVGTASKDGADPHELSPTNIGWALMAVDASSIYWMGQGTRTLNTIPRVGGEARVLAQQNSWENPPDAIAVDRDYVYSTHLEPNYRITSVERTDKLLGTSQLLLRGSDLHGAKLAVDDDALYVVTPGWDFGGRVLRVVKP